MIIGILGPAGAGKSTCANYLITEYVGEKFAFADDLKILVGEAFELDRAQLYGSQEQKEAVDQRYSLSGRNFMTRVGEAAKKVWGPNFWVNSTLHRALNATHLAVIEDVRFPQEADAIIAAGGHVWRLNSPWAKSQADKSHASESSWTQCRFTHSVEPAGYGLDLLYDELDKLAALVGLVGLE